METLPKEYLRGIQSKDVFERYFLKSYEEANGYLYHLNHGPYYLANAKEEEGAMEGGKTPIDVYDEEAEPLRKGTGDETPDIELSDDELALLGLGDLKEDVNENEFVYLPEYRNLYELNYLYETTRPKILRVENSYSAIDFRPVKNSYRGVWSANSKDLEEMVSLIKKLEKNCFEAEEGLLRNSVKYWIGDGRFTGFYDHLYYLERTEGRLYTLKKHQLDGLDTKYYCNMRNDLKNALHLSRNGVSEMAKHVLKGVQEILSGHIAKVLDLPLKF